MPILLALTFAAALGTPSAPGCIDGRSGRAPVSFEGRLERRIFAGPPNYDSIRRGDRPEPAYILTLDRRICIDDGGQFAELNNRFNTIQLFSGNRRLNARLRAGVGHRVRITGDGFAAQTGHHHASLVVDLRSLAVVRR